MKLIPASVELTHSAIHAAILVSGFPKSRYINVAISDSKLYVSEWKVTVQIVGV
jgi:hypothetical protein